MSEVTNETPSEPEVTVSPTDNVPVSNTPADTISNMVHDTSSTNSVSTKSTPLSEEELNKNWNDLGVHRCPNCKFSTDQEELFNIHTTTCLVIRPIRFTYSNNRYTCHACGGITWTSQSEFEEHIVIHIQEQPYVCFACKKDFPSRRLIELHVKGDHPDGKARSGLRGIKKGRKCLQELLENGVVTVNGKLQVPKTPHNTAFLTNSNIGENTVKTVIETLTTPSESSNTISETSNSIQETSNTISESSNSISETSTSTSESLNTNSENVSTPKETSNSILENSNTISETSNSIQETSITISESSNTISESSNTISETSTSTSESLNTISETVKAPSETSNTISEPSNSISETSTTPSEPSNSISETSTTPSEPSNKFLEETSNTTISSSETTSAISNTSTTISSSAVKSFDSVAVLSGCINEILPDPEEQPENKVTSMDEVAPCEDSNMTNIVEKDDDVSDKKSDEIDLSIDSPSTRPMPPPRTSTNIIELPPDIVTYTSKGGTLVPVSPAEQAKNAHLNTLFGELNTSNNTLQNTYVSQKIKNIANPLGTIHHRATMSSNTSSSLTMSTSSVTTPSSFVGKCLTDKPNSSSLINIPSQSMSMQNFLLVPIAPPSSTSVKSVAVPVQPVFVQSNGVVAATSLPQAVPVVNQRAFLPATTVVSLQPVSPASSIVARQPNALVTTTGRGLVTQRPVPSITVHQQPVSQRQVYPALSISNTRQQVSSLPVLVASSGQIIANASPPYQIGATNLSVSSKASTDYSAQALQNLASLVCPKKQIPPIATAVPQTQQVLGNSSLRPKLAQTLVNTAPVVNVLNTNVMTNVKSKLDDTKLLFKVSPDRGLICEACKKFTKDEFVFRRHVWDHAHNKSFKCGYCTADQIRLKEVYTCTLVNNIVASLITKYRLCLTQVPKKPEVKEVIDITDDDNDGNQNMQKQQDAGSNDVIMIDDDDGNNLQLQIQSTFSIPELEQKMKELVDAAESEKNDSTVNVTIPQIIVVKDNSPVNETIPQKTIVKEDSPINNTNKSDSNTDDKDYAVLKTLLKDQTSKVSNEEAAEAKLNDENSPPANNNDNGDDDDNDDTTNATLLDRSLSEPENNSEAAVSKMLEDNLNKYDPSKRPKESSTFLVPSSVVSKNSRQPKNDSEKEIERNNASNNILEKQSRWAFYVCGYEGCSFTCFLSSKYKEHLQSPQHSKEYNYICGHCGQKEYNEDSHVRHVFTHASSKVFVLYKCPLRQCKYKTNLLHLYMVHLKAHSSEELLIKCNYCNKTFPKIEDLEVHLKQNLLKFITCPLCSFKFGNRYVVMRHMRSEHPERLRFVIVSCQIVCNEREINFYVQPPSQVVEPVQTMDQLPSGENLDIPALLDNVNSDKSDEVNNEESNMDVDVENEDVDVEDLPDIDEIEENEKSDKTSKLNIGKRKSSTSSTDSGKGGPKFLLCKLCNYLSYNQAFHNQHLSLHDEERNWIKRYICNLCPLSTDHIIAFRKHVSNHVGRNEIKFMYCTSCSFFTNQKCRIMDHVSDAHATPTTYTMKPEIIESNHFECKYCEFKARSLEQVDSHEKIVHSGDNSLKDEKLLSHASKEQSNVDNGSGRSDSSSNKSDEKSKKMKYHCEYCNQFFKHKRNLKEHLYHEHEDIDNKQFISFKCKYCACTSTMKNKIIVHHEKEHNDKELRILRKIEPIESKKKKEDTSKTTESTATDAKKSEENKVNVSVKHESKDVENTDVEEVVIPDGNTFKQPFKCPKCDFSTNMRLKCMIHLKTHPELKPIRPDLSNVLSKKTARKSSSSSAVTFAKGPIRRGSLLQDIPDNKVNSLNPFTAVKEAVMKDIEDHPEEVENPSENHYILGEQELHSALSACFIPSEQNMNFQCRICKQKIFKKFVLHRHILNHLKIVFFQCRYCEEGSIEKTLMVGHIQNCHPQLPILYSTVGKEELESSFKEKIFKQNFNDIVGLQSENVPVDRGVKDNSKKIGIVKKHVLEYQTIEDSDEEGTSTTKENKTVALKGASNGPKSSSSKESKNSAFIKEYDSDSMNFNMDGDNDENDDNDDGDDSDIEIEKNERKGSSPGQKKASKGPYKCPHCRYVAAKTIHYKLHLASHDDPKKNYTCSGCDYRGERYAVIKHFYNVYHPTRPKAIHDDEKFADSSSVNEGSVEEEENVKSEPGKNKKDRSSSERSNESPANDKSEIKKKVKDTKEPKNNAFTYKLKTIIKCKICGEKRDSKTMMYEHFKASSKCSKPMYKCSCCSFVNNLKSAIFSHAAKRHVGKSCGVVTMPICSKFKILKVPFKQTPYDDAFQKPKIVDSCSNSGSSSSGSPVTVLDVDGECQLRCQLCSKYVCNSVAKLQNHINTAHDGVKLKCKVCSYITPVAQHMINHCKNVHLQKKVVYESLKPNNLNLDKAENSCEKLECPKCDLKFSKIYSLQIHLGIHFSYKPFLCRYCHFSSPRAASAREHTQRFHPKKPAKILVKKDAAIEAKILKIYENAKNKHLKQKKTLGLSRPSRLDNYTLVQEGIRQGNKYFYCDMCGYAAKHRYLIQKHYSRIHRKRSMDRDSDVDVKPPPSKMIKLDNDDAKNNADDKDKSDENSKEPLKYKVVKNDGVKKYKCLECHCVSMKSSYMKQHIRRVHDKRLKNAMDVEVIKNPGPVKGVIFRCGYCDYTSKYTMTDIKRHSISRHPTKPMKGIREKTVSVKQNNSDPSARSPARSSMSTSPARSLVGSSSPSRSLAGSSSPARSLAGSSSPARSLAGSSSPARSLADISVESPIKPARRLTGKTVYSCNLCLYSAEGLFQFRLHLLGHEEYTQVTTRMDDEAKMACGFCSYTSRNQFVLSAHVASHMGDTRFKCGYCDYAQFTSSKIITHTRYTHSHRPEVIVDLQKKRFTSGPLKLVNLSPVLKLHRTEKSSEKKKFQRIMIETLESSDSSDDEVKEYTGLNSKNKFLKLIESDSSESEEEVPQKSSVQTSMNVKSSDKPSAQNLVEQKLEKPPIKKTMNIKTCRAASYVKLLEAQRKEKTSSPSDMQEDENNTKSAAAVKDNQSMNGANNMESDIDIIEKVQNKITENLPFEHYSKHEKHEPKVVDEVVDKVDTEVSENKDNYIELSVDKTNEHDKEGDQDVDGDTNALSACSETETQPFEYETQDFDADDIAKFYNEEENEDLVKKDDVDKAEPHNEEKNDSGEKDNRSVNECNLEEPEKKDISDTNESVETGIFERISPELFSRQENEDGNEKDTENVSERDEKDNNVKSTDKCESEQSVENGNVFEKFTSSLKAKSVEDKVDAANEGDSDQTSELEQMEEEIDQESEGNIFDKFNSDKAMIDKAVTDDESNTSKHEEVEDMETENNIFDKFAYSESDNLESKKEEEKEDLSDNNDHQNIFDKFNVGAEETDTNSDERSNKKRSDKTQDLDSGKKAIPEGSFDIDKSPVEKEIVEKELASKTSTSGTETSTKTNAPSYDDMEVDELINSIEEAVVDYEDSVNTKSNDTNNMDLS